jgi:hypothetical protein
MGRRYDPTATRNTVFSQSCENDTASSFPSGHGDTIEVIYDDPSNEQLERARHAAKRARERATKQRRKEAPISKATCRHDADHGDSTLDDARRPVRSHYTGMASQDTHPRQVSTTQSQKSKIAQPNAYWDSTLPQGPNEKASDATTQWVYSTDDDPRTFQHGTAAPLQQTTYLTASDSDVYSGKRDDPITAEKSGRSRKQRKAKTNVRGGGCRGPKCQCDECWLAKDPQRRRINSKGSRVVRPGASAGCTVLKQ